MVAPTVLEAYIVFRRRMQEEADEVVESFLRRYRIDVIEFRSGHLSVACIAFDAYGKGRHPARSNFGDLFAYAVAQVENEPLLFVGDDFALTDVRRA